MSLLNFDFLDFPPNRRPFLEARYLSLTGRRYTPSIHHGYSSERFVALVQEEAATGQAQAEERERAFGKRFPSPRRHHEWPALCHCCQAVFSFLSWIFVFPFAHVTTRFSPDSPPKALSAHFSV